VKVRVIRVQSRICIGGPVLQNEILCRDLPADRYSSILVGGSVDESEYDLYSNLKANGIDIRIPNTM